jgi:hypothetical protein
MRKDDFDSEITDLDGYSGRGAYDGVEDVADEQLLGASTIAKIREAEEEEIVVEETVVAEIELEDSTEAIVEETIVEVVEEVVVGDDEENE